MVLVGLIMLNVTVSAWCAEPRQDLNDGDRGDSAFVEDLARVKAVSKQKAKDRGVAPQAADSYVSEQLEKYNRFNKFAKETFASHSKAIAAGRREPEKLLAAGEAKLAADKNSWEGHDFVATAKLFKRDIKGAAESYAKALETSPVEARGWYQYMLGVTSQMNNNQDQALEWMDKAIKDNNNWVAVKSAYLNKAAICVSKSSFEKAAANLKLYFAMARAEEARVVADGPVCKKMISAGIKVDGCDVK